MPNYIFADEFERHIRNTKRKVLNTMRRPTSLLLCNKIVQSMNQADDEEWVSDYNKKIGKLTLSNVQASAGFRSIRNSNYKMGFITVFLVENKVYDPYNDIYDEPLEEYLSRYNEAMEINPQYTTCIIDNEFIEICKRCNVALDRCRLATYLIQEG